jgi:HSP20 family protein
MSLGGSKYPQWNATDQGIIEEVENMSTIARWEPFRDLVTMRDRMDRLFHHLGSRNTGNWGEDEGLTAGVWNPPVDVYETGDGIVLKADIPDVNQNNVDISVQGNILTIKGERKREKEVEEKEFYRMERTFGAFQRSFSLPPTVDTEKINANFSQGVLQVTLPKREESKPKQIKVQVQSDGK